MTDRDPITVATSGGRFNIDLLKAYVSPAIDEKPVVELDDLSAEFPEIGNSLTRYFLNSVFTGNLSGTDKQFTELLITRVMILVNGYTAARLHTISYSNKWKAGSPGIARYILAIGEWESVFLNLQKVFDIFKVRFGAEPSGVEQIIHRIANRIKHFAEDINEGKTPGPGTPLWLTRSGFATVGQSVSFEQMAGQVRMLSQMIECLAEPVTAKQRLGDLLTAQSDN